jgi:hypothetical protein
MKAILIATVAAFGLSGFAFAGEGTNPTIMTDAQMDQVVAGESRKVVIVNTGEGVILLTNGNSNFPPPTVILLEDGEFIQVPNQTALDVGQP